MPDFSNGVATPGGASYMAPLLKFDQIANWPNDYYQGVFNQQQQGLNDQTGQLNQAKLQQIQQQIELSKAFAGGLPTDPATGQIDYRKAAAILAAKGDVGGAVSLLQQQPPPLSPMFGGPQGGQPAPQGGGPQPQSVPAKPLPPPAANSPRGDSGNNTVTSLVTDKLPSQNQTTGETIAKIAQTMGVDPNADLTPGQLRRAQGLLNKYAPEVAGMTGSGGNLPPSANAVSPAPSSGNGTGATPAGRTGASVPPGGGSVAPVPAAAPQPQPPQGPLTPQVPLPKGFNDPQQAITALRAEAARLSGNPRGAGQARELDNWADRIEESLKPVDVSTNTTRLDPRTGKILYQGPGAAGAANNRETGATLDADAENYRQTGKLPPNMGRGVQGQAESNAIRTRAAEMEIAEGGNPADWSGRWQSFATQAAGKRALETRAAGLSLAENEASSLIPRVREISGKIKRTEYPTINSLILAAQKGSGGQDVIKLGIAIESLVPVYARVLKPVGQVGQGDMARAHDILDKAWSDGQIGAALDQMQVELKSARTALDKTMAESENRNKGKKEAPDSKASKPDADGWVTLPNGARIQEVKQ